MREKYLHYHPSSTAGRVSPGRWLKSYRQICVMSGGLAFMIMGPVVRGTHASCSISTTVSTHLLKRSYKIDRSARLLSSRIAQHETSYPSILDLVISDLTRGGDAGESSHPPFGHVNNNNNYQNHQHDYKGVNSSYGQSNVLEANEGMIPSQVPQQQQEAYERRPYPDGSAEYPGGYNSNEQIYHGQRESVEDRLAAWRSHQQVCLHDNSLRPFYI